MKPFQTGSAVFSEPEVGLRKLDLCTLTTLLVLFLVTAVSMASATSLAIVNADFSAIPVVCGGGFAYQSFGGGGDCSSPNPQQDFNATPGFGWTYLLFSGNGVTEPNSAFNPPSFVGMPFAQAAFLQDGASFVLQAIGGFSASQTYVLSFYLGSRWFSAEGDQTVQASIDNKILDTWVLTSFTPFTRETVVFTVPTDGVHTLQFEGLHFGDDTAFLSGVAINTVPEPSSLALMLAGVLGAGAVRVRSAWQL